MLLPMPVGSIDEADADELLQAIRQERDFKNLKISEGGTPLEKCANLLLEAMRQNPVKFMIAVTNPDNFHSNQRLQRLTAKVFSVLDVALLNNKPVKLVLR